VFEFSVIRKYLVPQRKQLSVALIASMSVGVIALVVWLVLIFLSVTEGIEKNWLEKLTTLNAPVRINPTEAYYSSYYYLSDSLSSSSHYTAKTIAEKAGSLQSDPYNPSIDQEIPPYWPSPHKNASGHLIDPVKIAYEVLDDLKKKDPTLYYQDYEISGAMLKLELKRGRASQTMLTQASYLLSFSDESPFIQTLLLEPSSKDINQITCLSQGAPLPFHKLKTKFVLPFLGPKERGVLLSKNFQDSGVLIGDQGFLSYEAATAGSVQEQRLPIYVAGFYDPGIMSVGTRSILVDPQIPSLINAATHYQYLEKTQSSGIQVWFKNIKEAQNFQRNLSQAFAKNGIDCYWNIITYKDYDFAKDLLQQFQSDRYLFTLIGIIILIVACCNIISMLVILVNDKKREIGILQAMGATPRSIAFIFGGCGAAVGILSSAIGVGAALLTLQHLGTLVQVLSFIQGHEAFNAAFFGKNLPNELSHQALTMILIATPIISFLAGLVPAIKACRLKPSEILRAE
jgi:lipoprotein-releasing system permease protein